MCELSCGADTPVFGQASTCFRMRGMKSHDYCNLGLHCKDLNKLSFALASSPEVVSDVHALLDTAGMSHARPVY